MLVADRPRHLLEIIARFSRSLRESSAIAAAETVAAAALRRAALTGEEHPVARPVDLEAVPTVLPGKLEFASGEEGREAEHREHLLRRATADTARARLRAPERPRRPPWWVQVDAAQPAGVPAVESSGCLQRHGVGL